MFENIYIRGNKISCNVEGIIFKSYSTNMIPGSARVARFNIFTLPMTLVRVAIDFPSLPSPSPSFFRSLTRARRNPGREYLGETLYTSGFSWRPVIRNHTDRYTIRESERKVFVICNYNHLEKQNKIIWWRRPVFKLNSTIVSVIIILRVCYYYYFTKEQYGRKCGMMNWIGKEAWNEKGKRMKKDVDK